MVTQAIPYSEDIDPQLSCLYVQDKAMVDWILEMRIRGQSLRAQHGWVSRFFGQQHDLYESPEGGNPQRQTLPLPLVSVTQSAITPDPARNQNVRITHMGFDKSRIESKIRLDTKISTSDLYHGNGTTTVFEHGVLTGAPITPSTVTMTFIIGGITYTETSNDDGIFSNTNGQLISATVTHGGGYVTLDFDTAPDNNTHITFTYIPVSVLTQFYGFQWPMPINIEYQIDLWAKTGQDLQMMRSAILSRFEHHPSETFIQTNFPFYGNKMIPLEFVSDSDVSDLESDEKERTLRRSMLMVMKGWLLKRPTVSKTATGGFHVVFFEGLPEDNGMDWYLDESHVNLNSTGTAITSVTENPSIVPPNKTLMWVSFNQGIITDVGGV